VLRHDWLWTDGRVNLKGIMQTAKDDTATLILDAAERLVQTRGFNGFSYADIADELGVTKASLHYHFRSKADLGTELITRYTARFLSRLTQLDGGRRSAPSKIDAYIAIYHDVLKAGRMCLCGMLAADYATLPKPMQDGIRQFFNANEEWLAAVLAEGRDAETLNFKGRPADVARSLIGSLEGAMLLARSFGDNARFRSAADRARAELEANRK
jgi:TetR/AcrR family transcriptional regulator, transcriptional repressor for nem operon